MGVVSPSVSPKRRVVCDTHRFPFCLAPRRRREIPRALQPVVARFAAVELFGQDVDTDEGGRHLGLAYSKPCQDSILGEWVAFY